MTAPATPLHAAQRLEAELLSQVFSAMKVGEPPGLANGGPGEAQFASFYRQALAENVASRGGLGLAEVIVRAMGE